MIESFADKDTEDFYRGVFIKKLQNIAAVAARKLAMLAAAESLTIYVFRPAIAWNYLKATVAVNTVSASMINIAFVSVGITAHMVWKSSIIINYGR